MSKIFELDKKTIEAIAAGEVISRPESIIKETVENSIDAHASEITIEIKNGGKTYIRISDNGDGIAKEDLKLAFKKHFTSKLSSYEQLFSIKTRGFRGEALNSISTVSEVELISKEKDANSAYKIDVNYGEYSPIEEAVSNQGTTIICKNLFGNMPVRKTFLASERTEENRIVNLVESFAVGYPAISFQLIANNRFILNTSGSNNLKTAIFEVFGFDVATNIIEVDYKDMDYSLSGYVGNFTLHKPNNSMQMLYVNGRLIQNDDLKKQINTIYTGKIPHQKKPVFFLFIHLPEDAVDVNYHPAKKIVKFNDYYRVVELLKEGVSTGINQPQDFVVKDSCNEHITFVVKEDKVENYLVENIEEIYDKEEIDRTAEEPTYKTNTSLNERKSETNNAYEEELRRIQTDDFQYEMPHIIVKEEKELDANALTVDHILPNDSIWEFNKKLGFLFGDYYLIENKRYDLLVIIDVKAVLETVLYQNYQEDIKSGHLVIQDILDPYVYKYDRHTIESMARFQKEMLKFGFDYDIIGEDKLILRGIPAILSDTFTLNLFDSLTAILVEGNSITRYVEKNILLSVSMVASNLAHFIDETNFLISLKELLKMKDKDTSPQGRQIFTMMTKNDFKKRNVNV